MYNKYLIVGLGNPGIKYRNTRHNIGFMVLEQLADELNASFKKHDPSSQVAKTHFKDYPLLLAMPQTYMNLSGLAVQNISSYYKIDLSKMLVIVDDVNLPLGKLRLRSKGSAGGHNGLKSIIKHVHTQDFARLRLGISPIHNNKDLANFVLSAFAKSEKEAINQMIILAIDAIKSFLLEGIDVAMNKFNG